MAPGEDIPLACRSFHVPGRGVLAGDHAAFEQLKKLLKLGSGEPRRLAHLARGEKALAVFTADEDKENHLLIERVK